MNNKSEAYQQGYDAGKRGLIPPDNPYEKGTKEYDDWLDGLIDASL